MKAFTRTYTLIAVILVAGLLTGCATGPYGPYYRTAQYPSVGEPLSPLSLGPGDRTYVLHVNDQTPFGLYQLPLTENVLYDWGYDRVRRQREADFTIDILFTAGLRDNPDVRTGNVVGGALFGAAAGAIIGGATGGNPGVGAAIGAASGGALGVVAPADTEVVRIDIHLHSFTSGASSQRSVVIDLASVPPYEVQQVIDNEVARTLRSLPRA
jgi:hypothetical protein